MEYTICNLVTIGSVFTARYEFSSSRRWLLPYYGIQKTNTVSQCCHWSLPEPLKCNPTALMAHFNITLPSTYDTPARSFPLGVRTSSPLSWTGTCHLLRCTNWTFGPRTAMNEASSAKGHSESIDHSKRAYAHCVHWRSAFPWFIATIIKKAGTWHTFLSSTRTYCHAFLGPFAKLRKVTISFVMSVYPLQWKSKKYYIFLCACVCGYKEWACAWARVALIIRHETRRHILICGLFGPTAVFDIIS
jgi:hypothetical protein